MCWGWAVLCPTSTPWASWRGGARLVTRLRSLRLVFSVCQECPGLQPRSPDSLPDLGVWVGVYSVRPGSGERPWLLVLEGGGREHRELHFLVHLELAGCGRAWLGLFVQIKDAFRVSRIGWKGDSLGLLTARILASVFLGLSTHLGKWHIV